MVGQDPELTSVFNWEVRLALHSGRQLVHAQGQLTFEGRRLLTEGGETSEGALPGKSLHWGMSAGYRLGPQSGHRKGRGGRGRWGSSCLLG